MTDIATYLCTYVSCGGARPPAACTAVPILQSHALHNVRWYLRMCEIRVPQWLSSCRAHELVRLGNTHLFASRGTCYQRVAGALVATAVAPHRLFRLASLFGYSDDRLPFARPARFIVCSRVSLAGFFSLSPSRLFYLSSYKYVATYLPEQELDGRHTRPISSTPHLSSFARPSPTGVRSCARPLGLNVSIRQTVWPNSSAVPPQCQGRETEMLSVASTDAFTTSVSPYGISTGIHRYMAWTIARLLRIRRQGFL
jgi:hypothetical protein